MKIAVLGTRGFPNVQGGVEAHCENLYPRLAGLGCEVTVFGRKPYLESGNISGQQGRVEAVPIFYKGVKIVPLACSKNKFLEAFSHTFSGLFAARKFKPDILHIHAIGPSLVIPLARLLGMRVVMTHHGPDYERKKWGAFARAILRIGEVLGVKCATEVICISGTIASDVRKRYGRDTVMIPNGVNIPEIRKNGDVLKKYCLESGQYILAVGRFVPEKGFHDLIRAYLQFRESLGLIGNDSSRKTPVPKLVIVGGADHEDEYSRGLKVMVEGKAKVGIPIVLTGRLTGAPIQELYSCAGLFVLPSYYEGLPIALLEAMSYGLSCVVSDIPANREVGLQGQRYFEPGNIGSMSTKIAEFINRPLSEDEKRRQIEMVRSQYDWDDVARKTLGVYNKLPFKR